MPTQDSRNNLRESVQDNLDVIDVDLEDSDFEPGSDRELLGLFYPEVKYYFTEITVTLLLWP